MNKPLIQFEDYTDGARSPDDQIWGTYLHGLFESPSACNTILNWAGLERLADVIDQHIDTTHIMGSSVKS